MKNENNDERGFILVTSLILLSILTILGAVSFFKSNIEIKVSRGSLEAEQAFSAMNVGLSKIYVNWVAAPAGEFKTLADLVGTGGTASGIYANINFITVAALGGNPPAAARVYTLAANGTLGTTTGWGTGNDPQVAVWVTSFKPQTGSAYPYVQWNDLASGCSDCGLVVYALGRSGDARRLGREYMSTITQNIEAYGAMINAPKFADNTDRCASPPVTSTASTTTNAVSTSMQTSHLIDSTQAPGGVAIASNNGVNWPSSNKQWKSSNNRGTGSSARGIDPWVVYDPAKVVASDYPKIAGDFISSISSTVVKSSLFGTSEYMDYFDSVNSQLFQLDAYREAANRIAGLSGETFANGSTVTLAGPALNGLGNYSTLITTVGSTDYHRMGTLQWAEVSYNIDHNIPMYGLLRFMIPMTDGGTTTDCGTTITKFRPAYDPLSSASDPLGKLTVYGGALFDFFYDANGNDIYEPLTERLLTQGESLAGGKINVDTPLAFNPAMDGVSPRTGATACVDYSQIDCYPDGSPSWNDATDRLPGGDGAMDLIWDVWNIGKLWSSKVHSGIAGGAAGNYVGFAGSYTNWMTKESPGTAASRVWSNADKTDMRKMLDYYIRTTAGSSKPVWSHDTVALIEGNYQNFKISSKNDLVDQPSAADLYHTFLPSGYTHGWKRAMLMTGLANVGSVAGKSIWNEDLLPVGSFYYNTRNTYFNVTGVGNTAKIDVKFADMPAEMYAGGLVDMHQNVNTSGVVYTPGQLELEQKNIIIEALQYLNGIIITGYGTFMKNEAGSNARTVIAYDDTSIDNLPTKKATLATGRKYWQELK